MSTWISIIISGLSFVIAVISLYESHSAQALQKRVNEMELQIKEYDLYKIKKEERESKAVSIEARMISVGNGEHKIRVWNSGKATAYDIDVSILEDRSMIMLGEDLLPFEELKAGKSFDIPAILVFGSSQKFRVKITWKDSNESSFDNSILLSV